jgi:hypothetical protein
MSSVVASRIDRSDGVSRKLADATPRNSSDGVAAELAREIPCSLHATQFDTLRDFSGKLQFHS